MSRSTRFQRPVNLRPPKQTVGQVMEKLRRELKRRLIADGHVSDPSKAPPKYEYHWATENVGGIVQANTTGEGRAAIKRALGVAKLPKNIRIIRVVPDADQRERLATCQIGPTPG